MQRYNDIAFTDDVKARQVIDGSRDHYAKDDLRDAPPGLGPDERRFIERADSFYLGSVNADGWPYIQHRGGPPGFVHLLDDTTLAWAERWGNRQHVTAGNLDRDDRVLLAYLGAMGTRVVEKDLVELGADHLEGIRAAARVLPEPEAPRLALTSPLERAPRLAQEAVALDRRRRADRVEDGKSRREE